jgi:ubiquinone/menaquinone biosynthesis C-methylase UbiE
MRLEAAIVAKRVRGYIARGVLVLLIAASAVPLAARQLGSRPAEEWIKMLDSPERIAGLKVDEVIARLQLKPGDVVADLGAGTGVFSLPIAGKVGPTGKVYAVDIDQALINHIGRKVEQQKIANVRPILGKPADPALPAADVDIAFMHDVLHHIEDRFGYLKQAARYMKPSARFAFVEFDSLKGPHRDNAKLHLSREQLQKWMEAIGFTLTNEYPLADEKWYVVYSRKG